MTNAPEHISQDRKSTESFGCVLFGLPALFRRMLRGTGEAVWKARTAHLDHFSDRMYYKTYGIIFVRRDEACRR